MNQLLSTGEVGEASAAETIRVLHVDDDSGFRGVTKEFLERLDSRISVESVGAPTEALTKLSEEEFDCVVSDYDMPGKTGIDLLEDVRADSESLPFILFTGKGSEEVASEAISAGVTDYLQKKTGTDHFELLANRVTNAVEHTRTEERAIQTERQHAALFEYTDEPIAYVDLQDGVRIETGNAAFRDQFTTEAVETIEATVRDATENDTGDSTETDLLGQLASRVLQLPTTEGTGSFLFRLIGVDEHDASILTGGFVVLVDITDQKQYEDRLRRLQRRMQELMRTGTRQGTAAAATQIVDDVLDADVSGCFLQTKDELPEAAAVADNALDVFDEIPTYRQSDDSLASQLVWDAFESGEPTTIDNVETYEDLASETPTRSVIIRPLADYGVFVISALQPNTFSETDKQLAELLCTTLITALDRVDREARLRNSRKESRKERDRFRTLFENLDEAVVEFEYQDDDPIVRAVNSAFEEQFGVKMESIQGRSLDEEIVPEDESHQRRADELNQQVKANDTVEYREVTRLANDGERDFILQTASYADRPGGFAVYTDVTDRRQRERQLETQRNQLEALYESIPHPAVHVRYDDGEPLVQNVNRAFTEQFGYELGDVEQESVNDVVVPADQHQSAIEIDRIAQESGFVEREVERVTENGHREFLFRGQILETPTDTIEGIGVYIDITDRNRRKRELERKNDRLDSFTSVVSHDLRNPLNVAQGQLEIAQMDGDIERVDEALAALDRMEQLIEDLLTLAREGDQVSELTPVRLENVIADCQSTVATGDATLLVEQDGEFQADPLRVRQVFENLIGNAIKHGGAGVTVRIGCEDGCLYVADDGPGIPVDKRDVVFESGVSVTSSADTGENTGLGLAIVEEIVTAHGWEIEATASAEGGARFEITGVETLD